jgi:DNA-binding SARP family transcriptional activator
MEPQILEERGEDIREQASALLQTGERYALAGQGRRAETILVQVWTLSAAQAPDLANAAAWEVAWLLVRRGAYAEAAEWFHVVGALPTRASPLWRTAQHALVYLCLGRTSSGAAAAAPPLPPPFVPPGAAPDPPVADDGHPPAVALPRLQVTNLGCFQIVRGATIVPSNPAHTMIALFRYLLTRHHHTASKEELMDLFWPDVAPRQAANSLHAAVSTLRQHLDPDRGSYLLFEDDRYVINPYVPLEDDCSAFTQRSEEGEQYWQAENLRGAQQAYLQALSSYQGDYYVARRDRAWAINVQEQLLSRYLVVLDHLGQIYITQRRFEEAVTCYEHLLARDDYREDAHEQVMRCYGQLGRRGDALRQYERCVTILATELGLEPRSELQDLAREITGDRGGG